MWGWGGSYLPSQLVLASVFLMVLLDESIWALQVSKGQQLLSPPQSIYFCISLSVFSGPIATIKGQVAFMLGWRTHYHESCLEFWAFICYLWPKIVPMLFTQGIVFSRGGRCLFWCMIWIPLFLTLNDNCLVCFFFGCSTRNGSCPQALCIRPSEFYFIWSYINGWMLVSAQAKYNHQSYPLMGWAAWVYSFEA